MKFSIHGVAKSRTRVSDWAQRTQSYLKDFLDSLLISFFYLFLQARILERVANSLLQGIFPTQGSNPGLLHFSWILYQLGHQGSPIYTYSFLDPSRRRQWHPTPVLLPGKSHGWRSLAGRSPWGREESDTTERLHFHFSLSCIGEGNGNPLPVFLPAESQGRGSLVGFRLWGHTESDTTEVT